MGIQVVRSQDDLDSLLLFLTQAPLHSILAHMEYITSLIVGILIGCYAYGKGYRAQNPFYKVSK